MTSRPIRRLGLVPLAACVAACLAACSGEAQLSRTEPGEVASVASARSDAEALIATLPAGADPAVRTAREALVGGAPWRAAIALAPALADPSRNTPAARLVAAAAAAEREEWSTVDRLVATLDDASTGGFPSLLAARSALARASGATGDQRIALATAALAAARRSAALAPNAVERGVRQVLAARALDRRAMAGQAADADSARSAYLAAAASLPAVRDWIELRAAGVTRDADARRRAYAALRLPAARDRAPTAEAETLERFEDRAGAAAAYARIGKRVKGFAVRLADSGTTDVGRAAIRDSLVAIVSGRSGTGEAREGVELLDARLAPLTPAEELVVARSAAASGPAARAAAAFGRALGAGLGTERDRYSHATLLGRTGRETAAIAELARVRAAGGRLAGQAAYQRARLMLRERRGGAVTALQEVVDAFPADSAAATGALYLVADAAVDDGRDADARAALLRLARQWPTSDRAPRARFDAAIIALAAGDAATAARELDALRGAAIDSTASPEAIAATYWAGRAAAAAGDRDRARARWRELTARVPASYYAMLAARRLGEAPWRPTGGEQAETAPQAVTDAETRLALLERIGFDPEVGWERDALVAWAADVPDRLSAVAAALRDAGSTSSAMRLARRALDRGAPPTVATYRVLYPWPWASLLRESADARGLDPTLAAAVIRQESSFTPNAVSPAGAVGLMQLMPPVGRSLWNALGAGRAGVPWSPALLRQPDVNVALGTRHLATSLARYPDVAYALAAYNAGGTPVARWRRRAGTEDPELFVERIPYEETRDYVRIVTRNREFYKTLYAVQQR